MSPAGRIPADIAWAAYVISSWWDGAGEAPSATVTPEEVVSRLRRNGFPLLTLASDPRPEARALLASAPFTLAIQEDRDKMLRQQAAFSEIVATWRNRGIPALFVKAMGPLPSFPYVSNNLDVLVPQARQDEARSAVRDLGYVELRHIEEPNKFLLRRFHGGDSAFDLHIHGRLEWHTEFVDSQAVWQRAAFVPDCDLALLPAPEDGLLIALAHAAYENKAYKLIELAKFVYAARFLRVDWDRVADGARRRGWERGLYAVLASMAAWEQQLYGESGFPREVLARAAQGMPARLRPAVASRFTATAKAPVPLPFVESKRLFYEKMLVDPSLSLPARAVEIWTHTLYGTRVRLKLQSQRPMLVALDGIDGCGKSVQADLLAKALEGSALRHRVVWTRGGSSRLLQPLFAMSRRFLSPRSVSPAKIPAGQGALPAAGVAARETERLALFSHPLARGLWPWAIMAELSVQWLVRVRWPLLRGEVVVADRYVDTALVELAARLNRPDIGQSPAGRLLRWLAPRPDFSYWLDLPVDVALARKDGDESEAFLKKQISVSRSAGVVAKPAGASARRRRWARLDATAPLAELSDRIVTEVLRSYETRHWTVLNALFCANPRSLKGVSTGNPAGTDAAGSARGGGAG